MKYLFPARKEKRKGEAGSAGGGRNGRTLFSVDKFDDGIERNGRRPSALLASQGPVTATTRSYDYRNSSAIVKALTRRYHPGLERSGRSDAEERVSPRVALVAVSRAISASFVINPLRTFTSPQRPFQRRDDITSDGFPTDSLSSFIHTRVLRATDILGGIGFPRQRVVVVVIRDKTYRYRAKACSARARAVVLSAEIADAAGQAIRDYSGNRGWADAIPCAARFERGIIRVCKSSPPVVKAHRGYHDRSLCICMRPCFPGRVKGSEQLRRLYVR